jgi:ABC-type polysaccharide/polyol phosphate transport system ATPase subunit
MSDIGVRFDGVWKKFLRGERHDSLRDFIPSLVKRAFRPTRTDALEDKQFWAVQDVSFEVKKGEALGIIGPNGAGKSTALKLLTKILKPTRGFCEVRGRVGALIEVAAGFHPDLTGRENIFLQGAILGMKRADVQRQFDEVIEFAGVGAFLDTPVKRYSSGMQARLGFSLAAHLNPDVMFIDEVLSVGDIRFQTKCIEKLRQQIQAGVSVIFISHNLQAVATLCRRCLVLGSGKKLFDGPVPAALDAYLAASQSGSSQYGHFEPAFRLASVEFTQSGSDSTELVQPHTPCRVRVTVECLKTSPPCCVAFQIERTSDLLYCYGTTSEDLGQPLFECTEGDTFTATIDFTAHFARGHYRINMSVYDPKAGLFMLHCENVATFGIDEKISYSGMVDVEPSIEITPTDAGRSAPSRVAACVPVPIATAFGRPTTASAG